MTRISVNHEFLPIFLLCVLATPFFAYNNNELASKCPDLYKKIFYGRLPRGNLTAGTFTEIIGIDTIKSCAYECCRKEDCNVAFITNEICYHILCISNELCLPIQSPRSENVLAMVLVRPVTTAAYKKWDELLAPIGIEDGEHSQRIVGAYNTIGQIEDTTYGVDYIDSVLGCEMHVPLACPQNEHCASNDDNQQHSRSRAGTCHCDAGYTRATEGALCTANDVITTTTTTSSSKRSLAVSVSNAEVRLPDAHVTLTASADGVNDITQFQYEWTSLQQPEGSTAVRQQTANRLELANLAEGLYTFKVNMYNETSSGSTFVNVSVVAAARENVPPHILITPSNQTIKLPNTGAVLDASASSDDGVIVSWHWEVQQAPLGYQPILPEAPTLQLNDLTRPGNYTFLLTVTDNEKTSSVAMANVTVLPGTDYPPTANAGQDVVIHLPIAHNPQLILAANLSTDDHAIVSWEWTKAAADADKAVDMQDTHTAFLRLSGLEEGVYTFVLRVADAANQSSMAEVRVFVKPPTNQPPVAYAGLNLTTVNLPRTWVILDATNSTDDNAIVSWHWEQLPPLDGESSIPLGNVAHIDSPDVAITNVTGLTKGTYRFRLTVTDDANNTARASTYVTVTQTTNTPPHADAGDADLHIQLPRNAIYLNASASRDDWMVVRYEWRPCLDSLAAVAMGAVAEGTDRHPVLVLTLTGRDAPPPGLYCWNVTVWDAQGLSDSATVRFTLLPDPHISHMVELTLDTDVRQLTVAQYEAVCSKLRLLIEDDQQRLRLHVQQLIADQRTHRALIRLYATTTHEGEETTALEGRKLAHLLSDKLAVGDLQLLGAPLLRLEPAQCQNDCSGHGLCDEETRQCRCHTFWMANQWRRYYGHYGYYDDDDCSWSVLYVSLGGLCAMSALVAFIIGLGRVCYRVCWQRCMMRSSLTINGKTPQQRHRRHANSHYTLIENETDVAPPARRYRPQHHRQQRHSAGSYSDTDSDVVFESAGIGAATSPASAQGPAPNKTQQRKHITRKINA